MTDEHDINNSISISHILFVDGESYCGVIPTNLEEKNWIISLSNLTRLQIRSTPLPSGVENLTTSVDEKLYGSAT